MKDAKGHGSDRRGELSVPEKHQMKIAKDTLRMSDAGAAIMGGMSKDQARAFLLGRGGWSSGQVAAHEGVSDSQAAGELAQGHPKSGAVPVHSGATGVIANAESGHIPGPGGTFYGRPAGMRGPRGGSRK